MRKSATSNTWFDMTSGDGGQVLVDPTDSNYVYGTYFGIQLYRITDGGSAFFTNQSIVRGINLDDRSEFYVPFTLNQQKPNQLFMGTYRLYRTDNAKAPSAGDVTWKPISPDLTTGCAGTAPNGARTCALSAIGVGGGNAVYTGSLDGLVYLSTDAQVNDAPDVDAAARQVAAEPPGRGDRGRPQRLPHRLPRLQRLRRGDAAKTPGHVFKTTDAGQSWDDITGNLPDTPVNSLILDPSFAGHALRRHRRRDVRDLRRRPPLGPDGHRRSRTSPSGRSTLTRRTARWPPARTDAAPITLSNSVSAPALVLSKTDAAVPVGPGSTINYTLTVDNIGNAPATGVTITDPLPDNTDFVSAEQRRHGPQGHGDLERADRPGRRPRPGDADGPHLAVAEASTSRRSPTTATSATSAQGPSATGSPTITPIAAALRRSRSRPAPQTDGAHTGQSATYTLTATNQGYKPDSYSLSVSRAAIRPRSSTRRAPRRSPTTPTVAARRLGQRLRARSACPPARPTARSNTATVTGKSVGEPDRDRHRDDQDDRRRGRHAARRRGHQRPRRLPADLQRRADRAGVPFSTWDITGADGDLPPNYLRAFKNVVWFTGNSYPGPLLPYESRLKAFLDGGGRLLVSGQDILDQAAGTTAFVHDYLHILVGRHRDPKRQGRPPRSTASPARSPTASAPCRSTTACSTRRSRTRSRRSTARPPCSPMTPAPPTGSRSAGTYKVVFLAFPMEAYGTAAQRADLVTRTFGFFGT